MLPGPCMLPWVLALELLRGVMRQRRVAIVTWRGAGSSRTLPPLALLSSASIFPPRFLVPPPPWRRGLAASPTLLLCRRAAHPTAGAPLGPSRPGPPLSRAPVVASDTAAATSVGRCRLAGRCMEPSPAEHTSQQAAAGPAAPEQALGGAGGKRGPAQQPAAAVGHAGGAAAAAAGRRTGEEGAPLFLRSAAVAGGWVAQTMTREGLAGLRRRGPASLRVRCHVPPAPPAWPLACRRGRRCSGAHAAGWRANTGAAAGCGGRHTAREGGLASQGRPGSRRGGARRPRHPPPGGIRPVPHARAAAGSAGAVAGCDPRGAGRRAGGAAGGARRPAAAPGAARAGAGGRGPAAFAAGPFGAAQQPPCHGTQWRGAQPGAGAVAGSSRWRLPPCRRLCPRPCDCAPAPTGAPTLPCPTRVHPTLLACACRRLCVPPASPLTPPLPPNLAPCPAAVRPAGICRPNAVHHPAGARPGAAGGRGGGRRCPPAVQELVGPSGGKGGCWLGGAACGYCAVRAVPAVAVPIANLQGTGWPAEGAVGRLRRACCLLLPAAPAMPRRSLAQLTAVPQPLLSPSAGAAAACGGPSV